MDLEQPMRSVVPTARADVLTVLARARAPLSGRQVARLVTGCKQWRVNEVLGELSRTGLVLRDEHPPAFLYRLNRDHVAASAIEQLANLRLELIRRMREDLGNWSSPPAAAWLFGSFARGEARPDSDIDVLIVRPDGTANDDSGWVAQVMSLREQITLWSGNACEILELSVGDVRQLVHDDAPLIVDLRRDAIDLASNGQRHLLGHAPKAGIA